MADFPVREPVVESGSWLITNRWRIWLRDLQAQFQSSPSKVLTVTIPTDTATIATTPIPTASLAAGLYRVTYYQQVLVAAGVSSALTTTLGWTYNSVAQSFSGALMNGNTTATHQSNTQMIRIDQASPITYAILYASNPAAAMVYSFDIVLENMASA